MMRSPNSSAPSVLGAALRRTLRSEASRLALRSTIGLAAVAGVSLLAPDRAWANCVVGAVTVQCDSTVTTDTTFPANIPVDRSYQGLLPGPIVVTVDPGATVSGNGLAISNTGTGGITVTNNGLISVDLGNAPVAGGTAALSLSAAGGTISYSGGGIVNNGSGNAFDAVQTGGVGSFDLNITGSVSAATGEGVKVRDVATSIGVLVTTNGVTALTAGQDAIDVQTSSPTGNVTEIANGNIQAGNAGMVAAVLNGASTGNIGVTANGSIGARFGIDAENFGTGTTSVTTVGPVTATSGNGVFALTTGGDVTVTAGDVTSTGNTAIIAQQTKVAGAGAVNVTAGNVSGTTGIVATNFGSGAISVSGAGNTMGTSAEAIVATSASGNVDILSTGTITGATNGITATSSSGTVTVAGTGAVIANGGDGIFASSNTGNVVIAPASTVTATGGAGIRGQVNGGGNVNVTSTGMVTSTTGIGIFAAANNGVATVTANGRVSAVTTGVSGTALGSGSVVINANANVTTSNGTGILATLRGAGAGTIAVNQGGGSLITATNGYGIQTNSGTSTGATTIGVAGEIRATGAGNAGVRGTSTAGNITVNVAATGKIDPDFGISLNTVGGALTVNNSGLITGTVTGVQLVATGAGTATINNVGTITGPNAVVGSLNGGSFTLSNLGTLNGAINVAGAGVATSTWTNATGSTAILGSGSSSFSGSFVNAGTTNIGAGGTLGILGNTVNSGRVDFAGAGSFTTVGAMTNSGVINAQNNLTTNVVAVGGNYTGGGQFFVDYSTVTATADRLNIGGTASGNTNVTMNRVGTRSFVTGGFLPVVTVTPGAAASTFTSNTVFATTGFILESFGQNPSSNRQFGLIQQINPSATSLGSMTYIAESASLLLDEPISPYVTARTNPAAGDKRFSLWMRGSGGHTTQTIDSSIAGGGVAIGAVNRVRNEHYALQVGADLSFLNLGGHGWDVHLGVTGGWYNGSAQLSAAENVTVEAPFLGAYVAAGNGAFTIDGTVRHEWRHYKLVLPTVFGSGTPQKVDGGGNRRLDPRGLSHRHPERFRGDAFPRLQLCRQHHQRPAA
jgi:hypothetical protein